MRGDGRGGLARHRPDCRGPSPPPARTYRRGGETGGVAHRGTGQLEALITDPRPHAAAIAAAASLEALHTAAAEMRAWTVETAARTCSPAPMRSGATLEREPTSRRDDRPRTRSAGAESRARHPAPRQRGGRPTRDHEPVGGIALTRPASAASSTSCGPLAEATSDVRPRQRARLDRRGSTARIAVRRRGRTIAALTHAPSDLADATEHAARPPAREDREIAALLVAEAPGNSPTDGLADHLEVREARQHRLAAHHGSPNATVTSSSSRVSFEVTTIPSPQRTWRIRSPSR